jgi:C_GCAxxG_C_C family probable redox protein
MTKADDAEAVFRSGISCAPAVFSVFAQDYGLDPAPARKIATGFGAGIAYNGQICGAVTGSILAIGLALGRATQEDIAARDRTYELVNELIREFMAKHGSVNCTELCGYDLSDPEQLAAAKEKKVFVTACPKFVRDAAQIAENLLK